MLKRAIKNIKGFFVTAFLKARFINRKTIKLHTRFNRFVHLSFDSGSQVLMEKGFASNENVFVRVRRGGTLVVGKNAAFGNNMILTCRNKIKIGNDVMFGPNVLVFDRDHDFKSRDRRNQYILGSIEIGDNVWIGGGCMILKGARIGKNAVIAGNVVVNCDIPENCIYYGNGKYKKIGAN